MLVYGAPADGVIVSAQELRNWTETLIRQRGTPPDIAADVAEVLLASDLRGIASHGTARLPQYIQRVEAGLLDPAARPMREKSKPAFARFDANNGWGQHAGRVAVENATQGAQEFGVGICVVRNTNHYGIAGWYAMRIAQEGLIGLSLTNSAPLVAPTRARVGLLGTNPLAFACPAGRFGMIVLDMATSAVSRGRIEVAARRGEPIPEGWAICLDGSPALTPQSALEGAQQPLGGREETGGYKGYGLALVVDLLTGVLGDAAFGPQIVGLFSLSGRADLGQFFMAIDPCAVDDFGGFAARAEALVDTMIHAPLIPEAPGPVLFPGQREAERAEHQARHGITLDPEHHASLLQLSQAYALPFPAILPFG